MATPGDAGIVAPEAVRCGRTRARGASMQGGSRGRAGHGGARRCRNRRPRGGAVRGRRGVGGLRCRVVPTAGRGMAAPGEAGSGAPEAVRYGRARGWGRLDAGWFLRPGSGAWRSPEMPEAAPPNLCGTGRARAWGALMPGGSRRPVRGMATPGEAGSGALEAVLYGRARAWGRFDAGWFQGPGSGHGGARACRKRRPRSGALRAGGGCEALRRRGVPAACVGASWGAGSSECVRAGAARRRSSAGERRGGRSTRARRDRGSGGGDGAAWLRLGPTRPDAVPLAA